MFAFSFIIALFILKNNNYLYYNKHTIQKELENTNIVDPEKALKNLKNMYDIGVITEEEYMNKRTEIINRL